jgi:superfamily II DNA or RNA helicase
MVEVVVSSVVSIRGLTPCETSLLRKRFTFTPSRPPGTPVHVLPKPVCLCNSFQGFQIVPRDMHLLRELEQQGFSIQDEQDVVTVTLCKLPVSFSKSLDPSRNQPQAVAQCIDMLTSHPLGGGCLLSLPPGFGKTACALYISSALATRTLILVHTKVLACQWKDRVASFLDHAVPVVVSSQKMPTNLHEATHVIALLQTVVAHTKSGKTGWLENLHDMIIVDECHHVCAPTLCKVIETVGSRFRLGLSATISRKDGLDSMLSCILGPIAFQCERHDDPDLTVQVVRYQSGQNATCDTFVDSVNAIASDPSRLAKIVKIIVDLYHQGRHLIVLSDRLKQLEDIRRSLEEEHGIPYHMAIGGSKECTLERPVMLATYQFASEGLDIPALNTCILASPRVDVKQSVGRILRSPGGKPVVVDIVDDDIPILRRQFQKRKRLYTLKLEDGGLNATIVESLGTRS